MAESDFLDENGKWKCIKCGACCKMIGYIYPNLAKPDGSCINLTEDNECSIYEDRPKWCRIPEWYPDRLRAGDCEKVQDKE